MFSISLSYGLSHCKNEYKQPSFKFAVLKVCNSGNVGCDSYEQTPHQLTKHLQLAIKHPQQQIKIIHNNKIILFTVIIN